MHTSEDDRDQSCFGVFVFIRAADQVEARAVLGQVYQVVEAACLEQRQATNVCKFKRTCSILVELNAQFIRQMSFE